MRLPKGFISMTALVMLSACGGGGGGMASNSTATTTTGTVSGFGSVIINGTHYYTNSASFTIDDQPGSQSGLAAGQVVSISSTTDHQGNYQAQTVEYNSAVVGPISAIDATNNRFTALGQTIDVGVSTVYDNVSGFQGLTVGTVVKVSGLRDSSGNIAAGFVGVPASPPAKVRLSGPLAALDGTAMSFTIGAETINYGGTTPATIVPTSATLQNGETVVVTGTLDSTGTIIAASKVRIRPALGGASSGQRAEIEGLVTQAAQNGGFSVGAVVVQFDANTSFVGGTASDLVTGNRVEVHGTVNTDGSLQATKIDIELAGGDAPKLGVLVGALTANPDTTSTPNTVSLLGATVNLRSSTVYVDGSNPGDQSFGLSSLQAGAVVVVSVAVTPAGTAGGTLTLTALKVSLPRQTPPLNAVSGPFANASAGSLSLSVTDVSVTGQADCPSSGSGVPTPAATCTVYLIHGAPTSSTEYFAALAQPQNANAAVLAFGSFASGAGGSTLTAQYLDLQSRNDSGGDGDRPH